MTDEEYLGHIEKAALEIRSHYGGVVIRILGLDARAKSGAIRACLVAAPAAR